VRLPAELGHLIELEWLALEDNPALEVPPPDVAAQGADAVLAYLRESPPE
jgi:hypothetical protein